jgi:hypothetical protein
MVVIFTCYCGSTCSSCRDHICNKYSISAREGAKTSTYLLMNKSENMILSILNSCFILQIAPREEAISRKTLKELQELDDFYEKDEVEKGSNRRMSPT